LPDRELDRHALRIEALGIELDHRSQSFAGLLPVETRLLRDCGDASLAPTFQHGIEQRGAVGKAAVEAALGDAKILGEHLDPHALDPRAGELGKACLDPDIALAVSHERKPHRLLIRYRIANATRV
jgi:hypothetical protein